MDSNGTGHDIACFLGSREASLELLGTAIKVRSKDIAGKCAILQAAIQDEPMPGFPADWIVGPTERHGPHDVINDMDECGRRRLQRCQFLQGGVAALLPEVLDLCVKRLFAWKMLIKQRFGNPCSFSEFPGRCV